MDLTSEKSLQEKYFIETGVRSAPRDFPISTGALTVNGFIRSVRKHKKVAFAALGDGSSLEPVQVVLTPEQAEGLSSGAGVSITGEWRKCMPGRLQHHELVAGNVRVLGDNDATTYPLQKKYHTPEFLRTLPHLRVRLPFQALLLRLRSEAVRHVSNFFFEHDFVQVHPPVITSSDCEGAGEVFSLSTRTSPVASRQPDRTTGQEASFFGSRRYLTVSSQLHLEALTQSVGRVWALSPAFRAEKSDTPRHLSEFYMLEAELSFINDVEEIMDLLESLIRHLVFHLRESTIFQELELAAPHVHGQEAPDSIASTEKLKKRWQGMLASAWPRITYTESIAFLRDAMRKGAVSFEFEPSLGSNLHVEHERYLAQEIGRGVPVFVTSYPRSLKPFYMPIHDSDSNNELGVPPVSCFDLLVPDLSELAGGSLREHRLPCLIDSMRFHGLPASPNTAEQTTSTNFDTLARSTAAGREEISNLEWYLDLRRYGSVPHGGFGIGFDRLIAYISGVDNLRDVVAFPRWHGRCDC